MSDKDEYQATADSVSEKLGELYKSLNVPERAVLNGLLGQAAAAVHSVETAVDLPKSMLGAFEVRRNPLNISAGDMRLKLHIIDAAW